MNAENFQALFNEAAKASKSLASTAKKASSSIASGKKITSTAELAQKRLDICNKCPSLDHKYDRCMECGCFVKAKTRLSFEDCPLDKW